jgi:hypothetical protein
LCLPTAPGLPLQGNGDFGTSAFFWAALGQAAACPYLITWDAGRKAQWPVEKLNAEHLPGVAQLANWRGGSRKRFRARSSRFGHLGGVGAGVVLGRGGCSTADLADWRDRPHMTRPPTEAASISLELKDDAKQGRVCGIAPRGWRSVPLSFCVPSIQHIEAISPPSGSTQPCSPGRAQVWPSAYTPQHVLKIPLADALGSDSLNFVPPTPVAARYLEICEIQNRPRGLKSGQYRPEYLKRRALGGGVSG